ESAMQNFGPFRSDDGLEIHGITNARAVYWNLPPEALYEQAIRRGEGEVVQHGPLAANTGQHTGRSPNDKFIVREPSSEDKIWWGKINRPFAQEKFDSLHRQILAYIQNRDVFVFDGYAGADERYRMPVRVITEYAWHSLFARNMFLREGDPEKHR